MSTSTKFWQPFVGDTVALFQDGKALCLGTVESCMSGLFIDIRVTSETGNHPTELLRMVPCRVGLVEDTDMICWDNQVPVKTDAL